MTSVQYVVGDRSYGTVEFDIVACVSSGTYIRALARDLGEKLGVGAHLNMLRRTHVGRWDVCTASSVEELRDLITDGENSLLLVLMRYVLRLSPGCLSILMRLSGWRVAFLLNGAIPNKSLGLTSGRRAHFLAIGQWQLFRRVPDG